MTRKQILEMSLSEILNLHRDIADPPLTCMKDLTRTSKMPTAVASIKRITLHSISQERQNTSHPAGTST
jgi:hypothetical protein